MLHWITETRTGFVAILTIASILAIILYALPALLAWSLNSPHRMAISLLNLVLGWTVLAWLAALIWAISTGDGGYFDEDQPTRREPW